MKHFLSFFTLIFISSYIGAATDPKLDKACETAPNAILIPERVIKIKECVASGKSQAHCERYYKTYGDASGNVNSGNYSQRKYDSLPECEAAKQARHKYRKGSDRSRNRDTTPPNSNKRDSDPSRTNYR